MCVMRCPTLRRSGTANSSATTSAAASTTHTIAVRSRRPWAAAVVSVRSAIAGPRKLVEHLKHLAVVGEPGDERALGARLPARAAHQLQDALELGALRLVPRAAGRDQRPGIG